jgi:hypothetical protein
MNKEIYIATQRENIIAFARLYQKENSDDIFKRIIETYRTYIGAAEDYLELNYSLWTAEKETNMINHLREISKLEKILHHDIDSNYRSHKPNAVNNIH